MIKADFPVREFDASGYVNKMSKNISKLRDALGREFVRTALENIPVWSGASQATLIPLSRLVKETEVIPTKPLRSKRVDKYHGIDAGINHGKGELTPTGFIFSHDRKQFLEQEWGDRAVDAASAKVSALLESLGPEAIPSWTEYLR